MGIVKLPQAFFVAPGNAFFKVMFNERLPRDEQGTMLKYDLLNYNKFKLSIFMLLENPNKIIDMLIKFYNFKEQHVYGVECLA